MAQAAYRTLVGIPGTVTALSNEPCTYVGGCDFRITDATRRLLDRDTTVVVRSATTRSGAKTVVNSANVTVNFAGGVVTLRGGSYTASSCANLFLFFTGGFIPFTNVGGANNYSVEMSAEVLEDTNFEAANANGGYRTRLTGLQDVSISVSAYSPLNKAFATRLQERQNVIVNVLVGQKERITGRFVVESVSQSGEVGGLETEDISFQLNDDLTGKFSWL